MSLAGLQKVAKSQATKGGNFIKDGQYLFEIQSVINEQKTDGECFIVEFKVLESAQTMPDVVPNAVCSSCSVVWNLDKHKSSPGNVKGFILGLFGSDESDTPENEILETAQELVGSKQPARGMLIKDETFRGTIRSGANAGNPITKHKWMAVPNQADADIAKRRAALDAAGT